ncbi:hypothetical protein Bbelb_353300 [Branchiostoma belcheri]|nr:hypothetical protein Bbelb_353300 [Branchiostoma belcheri]
MPSHLDSEPISTTFTQKMGSCHSSLACVPECDRGEAAMLSVCGEGSAGRTQARTRVTPSAPVGPDAAVVRSVVVIKSALGKQRGIARSEPTGFRRSFNTGPGGICFIGLHYDVDVRRKTRLAGKHAHTLSFCHSVHCVPSPQAVQTGLRPLYERFTPGLDSYLHRKTFNSDHKDIDPREKLLKIVRNHAGKTFRFSAFREIKAGFPSPGGIYFRTDFRSGMKMKKGCVRATRIAPTHTWNTYYYCVRRDRFGVFAFVSEGR